MSLKIVAGLAALLVVGGGYVWLFYGQGRSVDTAETPTSIIETDTARASGAPTDESNENTFTGTMFDLARRGGDWKCYVDTNAMTGVGAVGASGTTYVSGEKVRSDMRAALPGVGSIEVHMISDGKDVHSWSSFSKNGFKTSISQAEKVQPDTAPVGAGSDANQSYMYQCIPQQVDDALFVPPTDITFTTTN